MKTNLFTFLKRLPTALLLVVFTAAFNPAAAQNLFAPVAKINDRVITAYEVSQRTAFLKLLNAPGDIHAMAMEQLINERLQLGAADQMGIKLTEEELNAGMAEFAARANLETDKFIQAIGAGGVSAESFRDFVSAGLKWRNILRMRFAPTVQISEAEIDRAVALTQPGAGVRVLLSEIVLPADTPESAKASSQRATALSKITSLTAFASAAQKYSVSPSRGRSGRLDWMDISNLPANVSALVLPLSPGQVTPPIPVRNGIALFQMRAISETDVPAASDVSIDYAAFYIDGAASGAAAAQAAKIRNDIDTCDDLYGVAHGLPQERLQREVLPVSQVPADFALELAKLDDNEISTALTRSDGQTMVFLMLCGRTRVLPEEVSRDEIRNQLMNQRIMALANGYLEDLRAAAFIEIVK